MVVNVEKKNKVILLNFPKMFRPVKPLNFQNSREIKRHESLDDNWPRLPPITYSQLLSHLWRHTSNLYFSSLYIINELEELLSSVFLNSNYVFLTFMEKIKFNLKKNSVQEKNIIFDKELYFHSLYRI